MAGNLRGIWVGTNFDRNQAYWSKPALSQALTVPGRQRWPWWLVGSGFWSTGGKHNQSTLGGPQKADLGTRSWSETFRVPSPGGAEEKARSPQRRI